MGMTDATEAKPYKYNKTGAHVNSRRLQRHTGDPNKLKPQNSNIEKGQWA